MIRKIIILAIYFVLVTACNKKAVKLPKIPLNGEEQITNHSQIWMFYNEENGGLILNEKNRISSTNWFFNIDKRLKIKDVLPKVVQLLDKHNTKSPHNTEFMHNYYSYANSLNDKLSFYSFDSIKYTFVNKTKLPNYVGDTVLINVRNGSPVKIPKLKENAIIQISFDANISFQDYLLNKAKLLNNKESHQFTNIEYIVSD